jgi:hypothetical protein
MFFFHIVTDIYPRASFFLNLCVCILDSDRASTNRIAQRAMHPQRVQIAREQLGNAQIDIANALHCFVCALCAPRAP